MSAANIAKAAASVAFVFALAACGAVQERSDGHDTDPSEDTVVISRKAGGWPPPMCETDGALVEFHSSDGFSFNDDLIIRSSGRGSVCWGRHPGARSGRVEFVASRSTTERLVALLGSVYCEGESPEQERPGGADTPVSSLTYHGPDVTCEDSTEADREAAYREASDIVGGLLAAALGIRRS